MNIFFSPFLTQILMTISDCFNGFNSATYFSGVLVIFMHSAIILWFVWVSHGCLLLIISFFFLLVITYKFDVAFNAFHGIKIFGKLYVIWWKKHWIVSISMVLCIQSTFMLNFHQKRIENEHTWWQKDNNTWWIPLNWIAVQLNRVKSRCALKFILIGSGWIAC